MNAGDAGSCTPYKRCRGEKHHDRDRDNNKCMPTLQPSSRHGRQTWSSRVGSSSMYPLGAMVYEHLGPKKAGAGSRLILQGVDPTNTLSSVESILRTQDYSITALSGEKRASAPRSRRAG